MNKTDLQKELLEKIKPGIKASDLKKKRQIISPISTPATTPPASPILTPIDKEWENKNQQKEPKIKELQKEVNFWSTTASNHLSNLQKATAENDNLKEQVKELKNNPAQLNKEVATALKEANQKIRDQGKTISDLESKNNDIINKLQTKIKEQDKTIGELKNQGKNTTNIKQEPKELFNCYHCKKSQGLSLLVLELPEGKLCQPCWTVLRKKTKELNKDKEEVKPTITNFTCHNCKEEKKEQEYKVKLDSTLQEYSTCSQCLPLIKEYNEKEKDSDRELEEWE